MNDDDLRAALHDAVADVRPRGTLEGIRRRTEKVVPMNRRWLAPTLAAAAAVAVVITGVVLLTDSGGSGGPAGAPTSATSSTPSQDSTTGPTAERAVPVYWLGEAAAGRRLYREFQRQDVCAGEACLLEASVRTAVGGRPADPDYGSLWPAGTKVDNVGYDGTVITIDLSGDLREPTPSMDDSLARLTVQQLVYSAQAGLGKGPVPVQLLLEGQHTDTIFGQPAAEPLTAANPDEVEAPVQVDNPSNGAQVPRTFTVTGRAATFEANVVWELKSRPDYQVVDHGFTTAQECCTLSPYSFQVTAPPGEYTLFVHDTDESGANHPINQDTKEITVK